MTKDMACSTFTAGRPCLEEEPATWTRDMLEGARDDLFKCLIRGHNAQVKRERTWHGSPSLQVGHVLRKSLQLGQETCLNEEEMNSSMA